VTFSNLASAKRSPVRPADVRRRMPRSGVLALVLMSVSSACDERTREVVYLEPSEQRHAADATEWDRFKQICESQAIRAGARHITEMDSYPVPGCRWWWDTRNDGAVAFDVEVCPEAIEDAPAGGPNAIVGTWPRFWNPLSVAEAAGRRAALYQALRDEFGDRVRVVRQ
jgi:hypothetical protein